MLIERIVSGKPSLLGGASGGLAGLVAVTPAAGTCGSVRRDAARRGGGGRLLLVRRLGEAPAPDRRHARRVRNPRPRRNRRLARHGDRHLADALAATAPPDYSIVDQFLVQPAAVLIAILWSAAGSALAFWIVKRTIGLRVERRPGARGARPRRPWRARLQLLSAARRHSIGLAEGAGEGAQRRIAEPVGELGRRGRALASAAGPRRRAEAGDDRRAAAGRAPRRSFG